MKVILINPEMGHGPSKRLIGKSGKCYGNSRWSQKHRCHIVEMTLEEFAKASDDLWRASNMVMRRWWPTFVQEDASAVPTLPAPVSQFWAGYNLAMDGKGLPDEATQAASLGWAFAHGKASPLEPDAQEPFQEPTLDDEPQTTQSNPKPPHIFSGEYAPERRGPTVNLEWAKLDAEFKGMKWFAACKVARTKYGIDTTGLRGFDSLIAAILLKLGHGQQPAAR